MTTRSLCKVGIHRIINSRTSIASRQCYRQLYTSSTDKLSNFREKLEEGPVLQDFIRHDSPDLLANLDLTKPVVFKRNEPVPFLPDDYLDGKGLSVHIETYGCQMNYNDSQIAAKILSQHNYDIIDDPEKADIMILMTCAIREKAEDKIWHRLNTLKQWKQAGRLKQVGVIGCMAERLKTKLIEKNASVDVVAGPDNYRDLPKLLAINNMSGQNAVNTLLSLDETYADVMPVVVIDQENRVNLNNWSQFEKEEAKKAFVSIMRGCNNMCTYCIVPFTRGRERSRPIESIVEEINLLSKAGCKEVTLLGQNVNSYCDSSLQTDNEAELVSGFKTVYKTRSKGLTFDILLEKVASVDPEMRIRFTSPHPKDFPPRVLEVIKNFPNICKSIHLPAQSGDNLMLEKMRRGYTKQAYLDLVDQIRETIPNCSLTSDFICGFCDESENAHQETLDLIDKVKYQFAFVYAYSLRERTHAHYHLSDNVPYKVKTRRVGEAYELFRKHALKLNQDRIGSKQLVLVDGKSTKSVSDLSGKIDANITTVFSDDNIPIGSVNNDNRRKACPGDYVCVEITNCNSQTLFAKPLYITSLGRFIEFNCD